MFDKEIVRSYLIEKGFIGHGEVPFVPPAILLDLAHSYLEVAHSLIGPIASDAHMTQ